MSLCHTTIHQSAGLRLHPSPGGAVATESQRGIDASCFENMWLGFDSTFIFSKCFPNYCLAVYTAVGGCCPSQTPYYSNAGQNPAASNILLASVEWDPGHHWSYFLHFGASPKPGWLCAGCTARYLLSRALLEQSVVSSLLEIRQPYIQPKIWGSSPWSGLSHFLRGRVFARAGCAALGAGMSHGNPSRIVPKLQVCDQRSSFEHSISKMYLWHSLSETLLLQPHGIPIRSHPEAPPL